MAQNKPTSIDQNLRLGIDAARTGHDQAAKQHLLAVLKQNPDNIPAMLWLAFVLPSPHDTIRVLNRVLALEPDNERAIAGIRWARGRLGLEAEPAVQKGSDRDRKGSPRPTAASQPVEPAEVPRSPAAEESSIRQQLLAGKYQKQAKKGVLAHRARRNIRPLVAVIIATTILGLTSIGVGALALVPPETLAAWLPASTGNIALHAGAGVVVPGEISLRSAPDSAASMAASFAFESDTLARAASEPEQVLNPQAPPVETESLPPVDIAPIPPPETILTSIEPSIFIGPDYWSENLQIPVRMDNLVLAHQPAYPDEKWIEVNLTTQQVIAWEGDQPVFSFLTSTGLPNTPTVEGKFNIFWKLESTSMAGPGYYLPGVPYTMYFYGSYALHGTYWHNNFGQPMSHGCVNLETGNAQKLFEWADPVIPPGQTQVVSSADNPGTLVVVHK